MTALISLRAILKDLPIKIRNRISAAPRALDLSNSDGGGPRAANCRRLVVTSPRLVASIGSRDSPFHRDDDDEDVIFYYFVRSLVVLFAQQTNESYVVDHKPSRTPFIRVDDWLADCSARVEQYAALKVVENAESSKKCT